MNDFSVTLTSDPISGLTTVALNLAPTGLVQTVSGGPRMVQRVLRWCATPLNSMPFDPTFGNQFFGTLGTPASRDPSQWVALVKQLEYSFIQHQTVDAQAGTLSADETVSAFINEQAAFPNPFQVALRFDVVSQAKVVTSLPSPLYFGLTT